MPICSISAHHTPTPNSLPCPYVQIRQPIPIHYHQLTILHICSFSAHLSQTLNSQQCPCVQIRSTVPLPSTYHRDHMFNLGPPYRPLPSTHQPAHLLKFGRTPNHNSPPCPYVQSRPTILISSTENSAMFKFNPSYPLPLSWFRAHKKLKKNSGQSGECFFWNLNRCCKGCTGFRCTNFII